MLGKCLDVAGGVNANGTKAQLWDCIGNGHQRWTYDKASRHVLNPETGRCLDATGQSSANGTQIQIWACNTQTNQQWSLPGANCIRTVGAGEHTFPVTFAGQQYQVTAYVPAGAAATTVLPVVVNLHGTQGTGSGFAPAGARDDDRCGALSDEGVRIPCSLVARCGSGRLSGRLRALWRPQSST